MEKCNPFEVQIEAILDSMRFTMSIGVWRLDDVRRATATNAKMASMSSCVCPTCRWWHEATPHRPDCAMHPSILCPCWFRISLTVLSLCNQSLGLRLNMVMVEGRIKNKMMLHKPLNQVTLWGRENFEHELWPKHPPKISWPETTPKKNPNQKAYV